MHPIAPMGQRGSRVRGAGWLVALVVLGVLAMHGLSGHGTRPPDSPTGTMPDVPSAMAGSANVHGAADQIAPAHRDDGMLETGMMCLAVLAGAALLLLLARRRLLASGTLPRRRRSPIGPLAVNRGSTGPPPVWAFSVIRC